MENQCSSILRVRAGVKMTNPTKLTRRSLLAGLASGAPTRYPIFRAQGTHRELGRQHGEQAASRIHAHLDYMGASMKMSRASIRKRALRFKPLCEKYCPHLLEEIQGLAEGASIALEEAMAVNLRGELGQVKEEGCTTYVISRKGTARRQILIGQNSDMTSPMIDFGYVLHLKPANKPEVLIWTFGGMLGYHGMNSAGVAHFANALGGGPKGQFALSHYPVKRMMLESTSLKEVAKLLRTVPVASNGNYVLCDGSGRILDAEATTEGPKLIEEGGSGFLAHTNHFLSEPYNSRQNYEQSIPDSFPRLERINTLIRERMGKVTVDDVKAFLRDHSGHPSSICRHPSSSDAVGMTVASLISEPAERRMHVAIGPPCQHEYVTYSM